MLANDKDGVLFRHDSYFSDENEKLYSAKSYEGNVKITEGYNKKGERCYIYYQNPSSGSC